MMFCQDTITTMKSRIKTTPTVIPVFFTASSDYLLTLIHLLTFFNPIQILFSSRCHFQTVSDLLYLKYNFQEQDNPYQFS